MHDPSESALVARARAFATEAHAAQRRKYTDEPYIVHPEEVARIVADAGLPAEAIAAAWLHDVVEDCGVTGSELEAAFGPEVARLVLEVSDVSRPEDGNRATRKALDRDHLARASAHGQSIKLADLISNTTSIVARDPHFAKVYLREKAELLRVLTRGDAGLHARASAQMPRSGNRATKP
jgi:(p)ppGpp synthase/HD superfamily hydrolase